MVGQIRNRRALVRFLPVTPNMANTLYGTGRNLILISVAVTGMVLPARMSRGTPAHRHESSASRTAT